MKSSIRHHLMHRLRGGDLATGSTVFTLLVTGVALASLLIPAPARAQNTEATFAIGALLGGDIDLGLDIIDDARASFDNAALYGGRLGWYGFPLGVEASVLYSPNGVTTVPAYLAPSSSSILYAEANVLLIIIPGPVAPFITGGVGLHRVNFEYADLGNLDETAFGWNWGGGLKVKIGPIALRGDLRDHITRFQSEDVLALLGTTTNLHNWEASVGIGVAF
ncbi:MAG: outer membrane beta-barrel protein [Acidobacteriota bacterium]|jgi:opacity protein-like surface antigen